MHTRGIIQITQIKKVPENKTMIPFKNPTFPQQPNTLKTTQLNKQLKNLVKHISLKFLSNQTQIIRTFPLKHTKF